MTTTCSDCGTRVPQDGAFCPECGASIAAAPHAGAVRSPAPDAAPTQTVPTVARDAPATSTAPGTMGRRALIGVGAAALVIGGFIAATALTGHHDDRASMNAGALPTTTVAPSAAPATATVTVTPTENSTAQDAAAGVAGVGSGGGIQNRDAPPAQQAPAPVRGQPAQGYDSERPGAGADGHYRTFRTGSSQGGVFTRVATLTESTTQPFMYAVADAYASSGANGSSVTLYDVYSVVTGKTYKMSCTAQPSGAVVCEGGNNAKVLLYN